MKKFNKSLVFVPCLLILMSLNAWSSPRENQIEDSTIEKALKLDILLEPVALLNAPILSEELQNNLIESETLQKIQKQSTLSNDSFNP
jgi:hypothetical protein